MVKILALETTEKYGSVALLDDDRLLFELDLPKERRSAQTLAPSIDTILRLAGAPAREIDVVAVVVGPGSFTGLRVGVATAKMFAYAVGAGAVALETHEVVAAECFASDPTLKTLSVGVDAQRGDVVVRHFEKSRSSPDYSGDETRMMPVAQWFSEKNRLSGPALERWFSKAPTSVPVVDERFWAPKASRAGQLAYEKWKSGETSDPWSLVPIYSRLSAAEEVRARRGSV